MLPFLLRLSTADLAASGFCSLGLNTASDVVVLCSTSAFEGGAVMTCLARLGSLIALFCFNPRTARAVFSRIVFHAASERAGSANVRLFFFLLHWLPPVVAR